MPLTITQLSTHFTIKDIKTEDLAAVYKLCKGNPAYYKYTRTAVTVESIEQELKELPPNKGYEDKFYVGFYEDGTLVAIMDLVIAYPNEHTSFIGLFMVNKDLQGRGVGTAIISDTVQFLKKEGYTHVRLGCIKENKEGKNFWLKNEFILTGEEKETDDYTVVIMERELE